MIVAINGNRHQENHLADIQRLVDTLLRNDHRVVMSDRFLDYLVDKLGSRFALGIHHIRLTEQPEADLAIAIGGDGAFLKTAAWVGESEIPVAGINTGHLGFLAAFSFDRPDEIARYLVTGGYAVEPRALICVETPAGDYYALNEVALLRGDNASMIIVDTDINGHHSLSYKGDGLIIATPTGSTAYNLSVGGPILDPSVNCWVISPIAAHSLSIRPLVINDSSTVTATVKLRAPSFRLAVDGKNISLPDGCRLTIRKAPYCLNVVTLPGHSFTDTIRNKLGLGE
ncbi:MAG: NAD(+)/NADH kinase [Muribaculaceae bacterium]|nr:NAD(+)/NADH kinase [Muribaculaceae bacterium]